MALTNSQYDQIMRGYEEKQRKARLARLEKLEKAYQAAPALRGIDGEIAEACVNQARLLLDGDAGARERLHARLEQIRERRAACLSRAGISPDDLEMAYECEDCKDTGYIGGKPCHCFRQAAIDLVYTQSNIRAILELENFDSFTLRYYSDDTADPATGRTPLENARLALQSCQAFADGFDNEFRNLFFYGSTGVGKTFLSNCVAKALMDSGHSVLYFTSFQLFHILEEGRFRDDEDARSRQDDLFSCDLLIIDDLGTELPNSFTVSQLFLCLNERLLRRKSTIISSNLDLDALLTTYSERNFSRIISNYTLIKLTGADIRLKKKRLDMNR